MRVSPVFDGGILSVLANNTYRTINEGSPPARVSKGLKDIEFPLQDHTGRSRDARAPCVLRLMIDRIDHSAICLRV